jgi:hypothetical protein
MRSARAALPLLALIALVFAQAAWFPFLCWDDFGHVSAPLSLRTPTLGYPVPLTVASYALLGRSVVAVHTWNVVLHAAVCLGVLALSLELGRGVWPAFLFAFHPLVAEPVAWATGRKDLLATGLVILAVVLHARRVRPLVTTLLYVLALAAKPSALPLPAILWAHDRLLRPERRPIWLLALAPVGVADLLLTIAGERAVGGVREAVLPIWQRVPLAAGIEAKHLFAPVGLLARYGDLPSWGPIVLGASVLAALAVLPFVLRRRAPVAAFAVAFAALAYLPVSDVVHVTRFVADVYLYLPLAGLVLLLGSPKVPKWAPPTLCALYLPLCFLQVRTWRSNVSVFAPIVRVYPDSPTAWQQLGDSFVCDGRPAEAVPLYQKIDRTWPGATSACHNLATAYKRLGRPDLARATLSRCR